MSVPVVLSLGSVNADFQVRVDEAPGRAETMLAHDFVRLSGGKAANVALLACRLGLPARLLARVGNDDFSRQALDPLRSAGVDLEQVSIAAGRSTGVSMIMVPPDGKKRIVLAPNANDGWSAAESQAAVQAVERAPAGSILVADYEVPPEVVKAAVDAALHRGFGVVIDPAPARRADRGVLARVLALSPNASEAQALTGIEVGDRAAAAQAALRLAESGTRIVCIKLEDGGCMLANDGRLTAITPPNVQVVDTTGAGDAFTGALAAALLEKRPPLEAACFAVAASTLAVTAYGSQPAYPTRDRIESLMPELLANARPLQQS